MKRAVCVAALLCAIALLFGASAFADEPAQTKAPAKPKSPDQSNVATLLSPQEVQEALEKQLSEKLTGATMVGRFTVDGMPADAPLKEDRYTLGKVAKLPNGKWLFETRIQYNDKDAKMPIAVDIKWAGDTPVITLTNMEVPLMGTFTARVLIYGNQYAGTWSAADHGGLMFGKIEPASKDAKPEASAGKPAEKPAGAAK